MKVARVVWSLLSVWYDKRPTRWAHIWLTCFAIQAIATISGTSDEVLPRDYCSDVKLGSYKRHPSDCSRYVSCSGRSNFFVQSCQPGLLYDERMGRCNYAEMVHCGSSPRPSSRHRTSPANSFFNAITTTRRRPVPKRAETVRTSKSEMMHAVHGSDDLSNFIHVVRTQTAIPHCQRDGLYPDSSNCTRYYICSYGRPYSFNCPLGTYFHPDILRCEFPSDFSTRLCSRQQQQQRQSSTFVTREPTRPTFSNRQQTFPTTQSGHHTSTKDKIRMIANFLEEGKEMAKEKVHQAVKMEAVSAGGKAGQSAFHGVSTFLGSNKVVKKMSLAAEQQLTTLKIIKEEFDLSKDEVKTVMTNIQSTLDTNPARVIPDLPKERVKMDLDTCPYPNDERRSSKYRTMDGSCNNLEHPLWGRSMTPFTRYLDPDYCDNIGCPRRGRFNASLPGARAVSRTLFTSKPTQSHVHTTMLLIAGQLLDHDLTKTALSMVSSDAKGTREPEGGKLFDVTCGSDGCSTEGEENRACLPIPIPRGDPTFGSMRCLMFVRTQEVPQLDCQLGPRQQLNQLTHYMDASMCYGSTKEQSKGLRLPDKSRGRLMMTRNMNRGYKGLLPTTDNKDCRGVNETIKCFKAGDDRANENVALTGLHVVIARAHNDFEASLHKLNPHWGGERLFQESRRIVGAVWQHIIYNEYLPIILGPEAMSRYGLTLQRHGYSTAYDPSVSAEIGNVFATAAFRFSHSMIPDTVVFSDKNYHKEHSLSFSSVMRRPFEVYNNERGHGSAVDSILHGLMSQSAMRIDRHFTKQITEHLFAENPPHGPGHDLTAINIQRGRDHGLPAYNKWREWCGLHVASDFNDLIDLPSEDRQSLEQVYDHVDEIDLFSGAVCEENVAGGMVGPTFACILGRQFRNLKVGDRFWYETGDPNVRFTQGQLEEIRKMTLSKLICRASDIKQSDATAQKYAMLRPISEAFKELGARNYAEVYSLASLYHGEPNERRSCDALPDIDLSEWEQ